TLDPPNPVNIPPVDIDPPTQTPLPPTPPPIPPSIDLNPGLITFVIELPAQTAPPPYVITLLPPSLPPCQPIMDPPSLLPPASEPLSPSSLEIDLELFTGRFTFDDANPIEADLLTGNNGVSFNSTLPAFSAPPNLSACILTAFTPTRRPTPTAFIVRTTTPSLPAVVPASSTSPASPDPVLPLSASPSPSPAIFNLTNPISSIFSSPDPLSITPHDPLTLTRTVLS
ncbi:MAG: hypothetical protein NTU53_02715, partial [Planctomycetota bacterium]|nr:hypothetical protein [Planctomycetota bacterium]